MSGFISCFCFCCGCWRMMLVGMNRNDKPPSNRRGHHDQQNRNHLQSIIRNDHISTSFGWQTNHGFRCECYCSINTNDNMKAMFLMRNEGRDSRFFKRETSSVSIVFSQQKGGGVWKNRKQNSHQKVRSSRGRNPKFLGNNVNVTQKQRIRTLRASYLLEKRVRS